MSVYRVVPIDNSIVQQTRNAREVASFLFGRRVSAYIVIKSDERGHRVVDLECVNGDLLTLQTRLVDA